MIATIHHLKVIIRKLESEFDITKNILIKKDGVLKDSDIVFLLIYRKLIEKLDAIFVLHDNGHENSSESITRDAFENYVHLAFIDQEDYNYRTAAYQYESLVNQLKIINWFDPHSKQGKQLKGFLSTEKKELPLDLSERRDFISSRLTTGKFHNVHLDWERKRKQKTKGGKNNQYPTWYNIRNGPNNLSMMSGMVGMKEEYTTVYSLFSHQVHSLNALNQLEEVGENIGMFTPIRGESREGISIQVAVTLGIKSLKIIMERFQENEKGMFDEWYTKVYRNEVKQEKNRKI